MTTGKVPVIGFGTYELRGESCVQATLAALRCGYRLIDTASVYRNEVEVGRAIKTFLAECPSVKREELFVTTKISPKEVSSVLADRNSLNSDELLAEKMNLVVEAAFSRSLDNLGLEYVDCYMMHWPGIAGLKPKDPLNARLRSCCWTSMCRLRLPKVPRVRFLAVSNFCVPHLVSLKSLCETQGLPLPSMNQIELHPLCRQRDVVQWCSTHGILLQQYSPLGQMNQTVTKKFFDQESGKKDEGDAEGTRGQNEHQHPFVFHALLWGRTCSGADSLVLRSSRAEHILSNFTIFNSINPLVSRNAETVKPLDLASRNEEDVHLCWWSQDVM